MVLHSTEISALHDRLQHEIGTQLGCVVGIALSQERTDWTRLSKGGLVYFSLRHKNGAYITDFAMRNRGGQCPVLLVFRDEESEAAGWAGWHEEWESHEERRYFRLVVASWTFFGGSVERPRSQVFRAEWDRSPKGVLSSAQPHWHFDLEYTASVFGWPPSRARITAPADGLEELPTQGVFRADDLEPQIAALQEHDAAAVHLGMAGWAHGEAHPQCWQCALDADALVSWAGRTLAHAIAEFPRLISDPAEEI